MKTFGKSTMLYTVAALPLALTAQTAFAQVPAASTQSSASAPATETPDEVGEIVVTAQRRSENVLRVPLSVTVVSGDALVQRGANDLTAVTKLAPSLQVAQDNTFSVRGVGTSSFATTVEASVSQVVDDVVLGSKEFASNAFYDIARVEVLNGPQGLLFGKNASAGLVNITTNRPKLGEFSGSADAELVRRDRDVKNGFGYQVRGTVNVPVGENSALRLNAIYSDQDSITYPRINSAVRNDNDLSNLGLRAKFLYEPTDALSIYIIGDYNRQRGITGRYDVTFREFGQGSQYPARGFIAGERNLQYFSEAANYRDSDTGGLQANINLSLPNGMELSSITAWKRADIDFQFDSDNTPVNFFSSNQSKQVYNQYSQELRLALPTGNRISGQAGLYYFRSTGKAQGFRGGNNGLPTQALSGFPFCIGATVTAGPPPACGVSNTSFLGQDYAYDLTQDSYAGFGQLTYAVTDTVRLSAGARLTHEKASIDIRENFGRYFVTLGVPRNVSQQDTDYTDLSYKVGAEWQATPDLMVYGFYGEGYKGPGFSNTSPAIGADLRVKPEISRGGEVGVKGKALDNAVSFSVSAFYTRFNDLQVQAFLQALRTFVLSNAATATTRGVDLSLQARPTTGLTLSASVSYVDAKFDDYPGAQCYPTQTTGGCRANLNSSDPNFVGVFNAAGYQLPLSARFTTTIGAEYTTPIANNLDAEIGGGYYHRSPQAAGIGEPFKIPTWDTFDLRLGVRADRWNVSLFCKNCTNEVRPISIGSDGGDANPISGPPALTLSQRFSFESVRTIGVRLGANF
ncbi:TonB-dependent receptor [uncultured Sphingomonas sp.]|uniref:TonB-dependent receptor n=1 Tax=uncultured Sphingomonas sp. TaxID=158754 RepID=UPI00258A27CD|nr:TonB-dependent receptor [uncultured Sphingomonas sp.]